MFIFPILLLFITECFSIETCRKISVSNIEVANGIYNSNTDYRGRPDFYREDGVYNLYGEIDNRGVSYWNIENTNVQYPYFIVQDTSYHPTGIYSLWKKVSSNLVTTDSNPLFECVETKSDSSNAHIISCICIGIGLTLFITMFHIIIIRRRLRNSKNNCPVCKKRQNDINKILNL